MTRAEPITRSDGWIALALALSLFAVYNSNGREIASYDSQPNKLAARELLLRHTLTLNHEVGAIPALMDRPAFVLDQHDRYRSAYSPASAVIAAAIAWPLWKSGLLDVRAPRGPNVIAVLSASLLTTLAVLGAYLTARQRVSRIRGILVAVGLGLGTGYWYAVSQTLWEHEVSILGLALAVLAFGAPQPRITRSAALLTGVGLALAGIARPQLAPAIAVLLAGLVLRARRRDALLASAIVGLAAAGMASLNFYWFGHALGPVAQMEGINSAVHGTHSSFVLTVTGPLGLLVSPNRGLLIFSPVAAFAFGAFMPANPDGWRSPLPWVAAAAIAQAWLYGSYAVWWAGHTYGPRYLLDVLPLLVPLAAETMAYARGSVFTRTIGAAVLAWSIIVSATGAFCYPNDAWNTSPTDVDRDHARLWSWSDTQIARCWERGPSPANFNLFDRRAFHVEAAR